MFIVIAFIVLIIQIVLCLKCQKLGIKFIPVIFTALLTLAFYISGMVVSDGMTGAALWIFGTFSLFSLGASGLGWLIAFVIQKTWLKNSN